MKKIIPIVILLLFTVHGFSKCSNGGMNFWPFKQRINQNSIFVIEGFAASQQIINDLGKAYKVYLIAPNQKIKLNVQELLVGQFNLTQAILKPEKAPSIGVEYELIIENLGKLESEVFRYNTKTRQKEKVTWTVTDNADTKAPIWASMPKYKDSNYELFGCGPAVFANFSFEATDDSEYLIKTTVKNVATGMETTYYVIPDDQFIAVGHDMCSGAFTLGGSDVFEVEFSLFDASGNQTKMIGKSIAFKRPVFRS